MVLSKADIQSKQARKFEDVDVPEWGGQVRVAALSAKQVLDFQSMPKDQGIAFLLVRSIVDANLAQLYTDAETDDLMSHAFVALEPLLSKALELNNLKKEEQEARKNSSSDQSGASPTA